MLALSLKFPGRLHHLCKVLVGVDGCRHLTEIFSEFFERYDAIGHLSIPLLHEVKVHLFGLFLSADHVGIFAHIVDLCDIIKLYLTIFIHIKLLVSLSDVATSVVVEITSQSDNELIKADMAVLVGIESFQNIGCLLLRESDAESVKAPEKLFGVNFSIAILVNRLEKLANSANTQETSFFKV
jgi:hypothetical protein